MEYKEVARGMFKVKGNLLEIRLPAVHCKRLLCNYFNKQKMIKNL